MSELTEVSEQMVGMMAAKVIEAIDGYPAAREEKEAIAAAVADRITSVEYTG